MSREPGTDKSELDVEKLFAPAKEAIEWSQAAYWELRAILDQYFTGDMDDIVHEPDPATNDMLLKIKVVQPLPGAALRKATEALNNTRHCFDQATYAACMLASPLTTKSINYPWSQNPTDLKRLLENRKIPQFLWSTFESLAPYPTGLDYSGGDDLIRTLSTVANNKHTIGLYINGNLEGIGIGDFETRNFARLKIYAPQWDRIKNEAIIARYSGDVKFGKNFQLMYRVNLFDAKNSLDIDVIFALEVFLGYARRVVAELEAKCIDHLPERDPSQPLRRDGL